MASIVITKALFVKKIVAVEENLKASERLSALGWLAAEVAHEIRNPLTVMQMVFHTMSQSLPEHPETLKDAELIQNKMKQMNRIVEQILTFARSAEPLLEPMNPHELLEDLLLLTRHKFTEQSVVLEKEFHAPEVTIMGDRAQLEQAILNLVLNACQAMPEGGTLTLSTSLRQEASKKVLVIGVKDTGKGMDATLQETLFHPFLTQRSGGTGLGLALVRKTAEQHGGTVTVQSKVSKGSLFELHLPLYGNE
jgi:signal transduction histidine kinase